MRAFIKKHPSIFGWLAFVFFTLLLPDILIVSILFILTKTYTLLSTGTFYLLYFSIFFFAGYGGFLFSIKKVILPLFSIEPDAAKDKRRFYIPEWIAYLVFYIVLSSPMAFRGILPFSESVQQVIRNIWLLLANYIAYRIILGTMIHVKKVLPDPGIPA